MYQMIHAKSYLDKEFQMLDLIDQLYGEFTDPLQSAPLDPVFPEIE